MHVRGAALGLDLLGNVLELLPRARDEQDGSARLADPQRGLEADPRRRAGDQHPLVLDRGRQRPVAEQRRVEVALPVVPELARVAVQRRHRDARAVERALRVACVERAAEVAHFHRLGRDPEVAVDLVADLLHRRQRHYAGAHRGGDRLGQVLVDPQRELRRVGRLGEGVQRLADRHRLGIHQVVGVAGQVGVGEMADVVHRLRDEVHRDDRDLAALRPREREPGRKRSAQLLEQGEHVVGPVDLVHRAGLGVADDYSRAVHESLRLDAPAHHLLGLPLGPVVVVRQLLLLVEHVLLEHALVGAGDRDRAGVMEPPDVVRVREVDDVAGALDIGALGGLLLGGDVVDRGEVEEVVDLLVRAKGGFGGLTL